MKELLPLHPIGGDWLDPAFQAMNLACSDEALDIWAIGNW